MNQFYKNLALWLVIGIVMIALYNMFNQPLNPQSEVVFSDFMDQVEQGQVNEVVISGDNISGKYVDGKSFQTTAPPKDPDLIKSLRQKNVRIVVLPPEQTSWYMSILISMIRRRTRRLQNKRRKGRYSLLMAKIYKLRENYVLQGMRKLK